MTHRRIVPGPFKRGMDGMTRMVGPPPPAEPEVHPDDLAVEAFAAVMKAKLAKKREEGYGGWKDPEACAVEALAWQLIHHVAKGDPADVANFAMFLFHRDGGGEALGRAGREVLADDRVHKTMTWEEYAALSIKGWHEVRRDEDGLVGVRYQPAGPA